MPLVIVMMIKLVMTTIIMTIRGMMMILVMLSQLGITHLVENTPKAKISVKLVTVIETPAC